MPSVLRDWLVRLFRVPAEPAAPAGDDVRVFRASPRYFVLKLLVWIGGEVGALVGYSIGITLGGGPFYGFGEEATIGTIVLRTLGWTVFVLSIPITYALVRLDYEFRWYIVTDRSLRVREGIVRVDERTMTFANVQRITVRQGPLQRLLGIADLEVRSAGGGGGSAGGGYSGQGSVRSATHVAFFRGVDNAEEIRTLIRERLRHYRDAGLGDPDDASSPAPAAAPSMPAAAASVAASPSGGVPPSAGLTAAARADLLAAVRELGEEARALREALAGDAAEG